MDHEAFSRSPVGRLVPQRVHQPLTGEPVDFYAFLPAPLPRSVDLPDAAYKEVSTADYALGRLELALAAVPNPGLLVRPVVAREAVATSALEGTFAKLFDVLAVDATHKKTESSEVKEVVNAHAAVLRGFAELETFPVHFSLVARLQRLIVSGTRGDSPMAGRIRDTQVFISDGDARNITQARFVPPPPGAELVEAINDWEKWIHQDDNLPVIVKVALAHYQFETLHPFRDGNGRVGRLVMLLQLVEAGRLEHPVLNISTFFEANKDEYRDLMLAVSRTGDFAPWVTFVAQAIRVEADNGVARVKRLVALHEEMRQQVRQAKVKGFARDVVDSLVANPVVTASNLRQEHGVSWPTAIAALKRLEDIGLVSEVTGGSYGRIYFAPKVLEVLEAD